MSDLSRVMVDGALPNDIKSMFRSRVATVAWRTHPPTDYADVRGLFTYDHPVVNGQLMDALPGLKVISNHGVGVDHIDVPAAKKRGIRVGNTPNVLNGAVADLAFALLLATARRLPESILVARDLGARGFDQSQFQGQEVHGTVLGIVGLGRIGCEVARRARGFQMRVLYCSRHRKFDAEQEFSAEYRELPQLLSTSDFVILTVPLTDQTLGMIGSAELRLMKPSAILINLARGPVVTTDDLVEALRTGTLLGAGLDVTEPEPLPRDHPLLSMSNVVVTSHIGSATRQTRHQMADLAAQNLFLGLKGDPLVESV